jgi:hypothetical protein
VIAELGDQTTAIANGDQARQMRHRDGLRRSKDLTREGLEIIWRRHQKKRMYLGTAFSNGNSAVSTQTAGTS